MFTCFFLLNVTAGEFTTKELIRQMIADDATKRYKYCGQLNFICVGGKLSHRLRVLIKIVLINFRPTVHHVLKHPFFWSRAKQLAFLQVMINNCKKTPERKLKRD